jgi:hypothetical protein
MTPTKIQERLAETPEHVDEAFIDALKYVRDDGR